MTNDYRLITYNINQNNYFCQKSLYPMNRAIVLLSSFSLLIMLTYFGCQHEPDDFDPGPGPTECDTASVTYPGTVYPILSQHCIACHSGAAPSGGIDMTVYSQVEAIAKTGRLAGAINHLQGYSPMPQGLDKLSDCKIRQIEIWIRDTTFSVDPLPHPCDPDTVYFAMDVLPILMSSCAKSGCHDATAQKDVRLDSYTAVMNSDVIKPGDPNDSDLYEKITEDDPDDIMPPPPNTPLDLAQREIIRKWIQQGAKNLFCDEMCDTVNVTYSGTIWPEIIQAYCFGCHNGVNASNGVHLENHSQVAAAANIPAGQPGSLWGAVTHASGNFPMPKNQGMLSDCKITQIRKWIDAGTPDN